MNINSSDISKLLHNKHPVEKYLCVGECKAGSSWFMQRCPRLDLWVMARSWMHMRFIGYEIKVSRSDFLNDTKWPDYLPYCSEFYFVSPPDIINPDEVPEQAGLLITSKNCKKLFTKKKAPVRDIEIPQSLLIYILMCRTVITPDLYEKSKKDIWKDRLRQLEAGKKIGHALAYKIRERVEKEVREIEDENYRLKGENHRLLKVKEALESLGVNLDDIIQYRLVRGDLLREVLTGIPFQLIDFLKDARNKIEQAVNSIENVSKIGR